jgi:hypothetical protein
MRFHVPKRSSPVFVCVCLLAAMFMVSPASAQTYQAPQPRRQFVTISIDWLYTQPLHFAEHPLEDLLGTEVASSQQQDHDYETRDGQTRITVQEFKRRSQGAGLTVYPLGLRIGTTLGIRGSVEGLPDIRMTFDGAAPFSSYTLTNARAYDVGAGLYVSDRSAGWGLGSRAFVAGGIGRISSDQGDGRRYFAEGGGGLTSGPLGIELTVKFAWNKLHDPLEHQFLTVPITIRGCLSF